MLDMEKAVLFSVVLFICCLTGYYALTSLSFSEQTHMQSLKCENLALQYAAVKAAEEAAEPGKGGFYADVRRAELLRSGSNLDCAAPVSKPDWPSDDAAK